MVEFFAEYGLFLAKALTIVVSILFVVASVIALSSRHRGGSEHGHIEVKNLNKHYEDLSDTLKQVVLNEADYKADQKQLKKQHKQANKQHKRNDDAARKRVFVLQFEGDVEASGVEGLQEEINAIISLATENDEVVIKIESPGGMVHTYGLAASQLKRIKDKSIPLTVCVDKVAASGGYMMACIADKILAAPFALIGSIGVMAEVPNFHRLLKKHDVDFDIYTAGEHKRTLTMFGENTEKGRAKFREELRETYDLFKAFIHDNRPQVDIDSVATGEAWYGQMAIKKKLVDSIQTSDAYLMDCSHEAEVFEVSYATRKTLQEKLGIAAQYALDRSLLKLLSRIEQSRFIR